MSAFGVYVHWPFCLSKCPYCDFNSHVRERVDQTRWRAALLRELDHAAAAVPDKHVTSIFFGGGTPSLMPPDTVAAVIERVGALWSLAADVEITLEANPTSVERTRLAELAAAGINRVSIGVQSFDNEVLRFLGREHDRNDAIAAIETAADLFGRYSFDLIYARPEQSVASWQRELAQAITLAGSHLSLYQLTIETGTPFHGRWKQGDLTPLDDDTSTEMFVLTQEIMSAAGMPAYEVSNHAAPGAESRHNLLYWRYGDYVGVGPGAHGRLTTPAGKVAVERRRLPERWLEMVERDGHGTRSSVILNRTDRLAELVIMGLRLAEGIPAARFRAEIGTSFEAALNETALEDLRHLALIDVVGDRLRATDEGRLRLNALVERLLA